MNKLQKFCIIALKAVIVVILVRILFRAIDILELKFDTLLDKRLLRVMLFSFLLGIGITVSRLSDKLKLILLFCLAFFIRLWWVININSIPVSDFNAMYTSAKSLLNGDLEEFTNFGYIARFPHLLCTTLYMAVIIFIFPTTNLIVMKFINIMLSLISIYLLYELSKYILRKNKLNIFIVFISAIFPPFISYVSTYCTENLAIPLYLLTMLLFFKTEKGILKWLFCGISLAFSNLFRAVGPVFFIAFAIYIVLFLKKQKLKSFVLLTTGFAITTVVISSILMSFNLTERPIWNGAEPSFATLLLKGVNVEHNGSWNYDDAIFIEENLGNPNLAKMCFDMSIDRICKLSFKEMLNFFENKFISQWRVGDYSGTYWATVETDISFNKIVPDIFEIYYILVVFLCTFAVFNRDNSYKVSILYILLVGFVLMFMIFETQSRYSYISSWILVILSVYGIEFVLQVVGSVKNVKVFSKDKVD